MRAEITFDSSTTTACSRPAPALKLSSAAMQGPSEQGVFVHPQGLIDISQNNNMNFLSQLCSRNTEHVQKEAQVFFGEERVSVFKKKKKKDNGEQKLNLINLHWITAGKQCWEVSSEVRPLVFNSSEKRFSSSLLGPKIHISSKVNISRFCFGGANKTAERGKCEHFKSWKILVTWVCVLFKLTRRWSTCRFTFSIFLVRQYLSTLLQMC